MTSTKRASCRACALLLSRCTRSGGLMPTSRVNNRTCSRGVNMNLEERLRNKTRVRPNGCWEWIGNSAGAGYGRISIDGTMYMAHRVSYALYRDSVPRDLEIDHLCRNPKCVNPWHLEIVDHRTNTLRGIGPTAINARKTHCMRGHEFNEKNTHINTTSGSRQCRPCIRARDRQLRKEARGVRSERERVKA